jgi:ABC-2 type transport system permease protein
MILALLRTGYRSLRRDRAAFVLSFVLPVAFFTIFGAIFGGQRMNTTPRVNVILVDEDQSVASKRLVQGLERESSLNAFTHAWPRKGEPVPPDYTAATAEAAVRSGDDPAALIIPKGYGDHPVAFQGGDQPQIQLLHDSSDPVAAQLVSGMLQKTVMTAMPDVMAREGMKYMDSAVGGFTPEQRRNMDATMADWRAYLDRKGGDGAGTGASAGSGTGGGAAVTGMVNVKVRDVVGEKKRSPMIAFYAAGVGVMFLLFTASATGGSLLDEAECGALDRILSARVSMTTLLAGKLTYNSLLASSQLVIMFLWAALVFHLDLFTHLPGFFVMTISTAVAVASFGLLLASLSRTRAQLGAIGTLLILTMSALGGSMFPRFLMPEAMQKVGLITFNAWSIDGYTKVFWRDEPVTHLGPQVGVLVGSAVVLFLLARHFAKRWEHT